MLVEPAYRNKYPPMGLMKISTYHKMLGDEVTFVKGIDVDLALRAWDRIYITTLFTFDFDITVDTINHYKMFADDLDSIFVGGIMSSLMPEKVMEATGLQRKNILIGLFTDTSVVGDDNDINVDLLPLDYDLLEQISYKYPAGDNYFAYTSRGCPNHCKFCAVPILEPHFSVTNNIVEQIEKINLKYGPKQNLLMLDNNILNAPNLSEIIDSLCEAGFYRGAKYENPGDYNIVLMRYHNGDRGDFLDKRLKNYLESFRKRIKTPSTLEEYLQIVIDSEDAEDYAQYMLDHEAQLRPIIEKYRSKAVSLRYIDFNQGVDGRRINDITMAQLARLAIRPLRIAFDDIAYEKIYVDAVHTAYKHGVKELSNYILFNFNDYPEDLYKRLEINIKLNQELGIQIFSFPMRFAPINRTDRLYVGKHWKRKYLQAISAILHVTKGVVAAGSDFFYKAFGKDEDEYREILAMPRDMIMFRSHYEESGQTDEWRELYHNLTPEQRELLIDFVSQSNEEIKETIPPKGLEDIIPFYLLKMKASSKAKKGKVSDNDAYAFIADNLDIE